MTTNNELILIWCAIAVLVVGAFFLIVGLKNYLRRKQIPDPLMTDDEEWQTRFNLRDLK